MSQKTKSTDASHSKQKTVENVPELEVKNEILPEEIKEKKEAKEAEKSSQHSEKPKAAETKKEQKSQPVEQKFKLRDIAKRCVIGYQEHWFNSIQAFAKKQGFQDPATAAECKEVLKLWGAKIADKQQ